MQFLLESSVSLKKGLWGIYVVLFDVFGVLLMFALSLLLARKRVVLYPVYFNADKSVQQGRRLGRSLCHVNPQASDLYVALQDLLRAFPPTSSVSKEDGRLAQNRQSPSVPEGQKMSVILESNKRHPRDPDTLGRVCILNNHTGLKSTTCLPISLSLSLSFNLLSFLTSFFCSFLEKQIMQELAKLISVSKKASGKPCASPLDSSAPRKNVVSSASSPSQTSGPSIQIRKKDKKKKK